MSCFRTRRFAPLLAAALVWHAAPCAAQDGLPLWELGAGAALLHVPHYRGSEQAHTWLLPIPYLVYRGDILRSDREGTRAVLLEGRRVHLDLSVDGSPPLKSRDNRARAGMADLAPLVEIGPKLNLALGRGADWKLDLRLPLRAAFSVEGRPRELGWTFAPVLNLDLQAQGWNLGVSGGPLAASRRSHAYLYGVGVADATATRPAYRAPGGFAGWGATLSASRRWGDWWMAAYVRHDSLQGAAFAASPLLTQRQNTTLGLALSHVFWVAGDRVSERW